MDLESQLDTSAALNAELAAAEASAREKAANARTRAEAARAAMICADAAVEAALKAADAAAEAKKANIAKAAKKEAAAREADAEAIKLAKKTRRRERKESLRQEEKQRQLQDIELKERLRQEEERRQQQDKELNERSLQEEERRQQHEDKSMGFACNDMVHGDTEHERLKRAETLQKGEVRRRAERVHAALQCERSKQESTKQRHRKLADVVQGSEHKQHNIIMHYQGPSDMTMRHHGFIAMEDHEQCEHRVKAWEIKQARERGRSERSNELRALCKRTEARWREQEIVENMRMTESLSENEKLRRGNLLFKKSLDDARQSLLERREVQCEVMIARIEAERQAALRDIASYQAKIKALEKAALKNTRNNESKHREKRREGRPERSWQEKSTPESSLMHAPNDEAFVQEAGGEHEQSEALLETSRRKTKHAIETMIRGLVTLEDELRRERVTLQERASCEHLSISQGGTSTEPSHHEDSNPAAPNPKSEVAELIYKRTEAVSLDEEGHHGRNSTNVTIPCLNGFYGSKNLDNDVQEINAEELKNEPGLIHATEPVDVVDDVATTVVSMDADAVKSIDADEEDVSTVSSNTTASDVATEQKVHEFAVGDSVEVRDNLNEEWAPGIVLRLDDSGTPEVQKDGHETAYTWTYCQRRAHGLDNTSKSEEECSNGIVQTKRESSNEFAAGDKVEVRDDSDEDWEPGTVLSLDEDGIPVVKKDGYDSAYTWTFCRRFAQGQQPSSTVKKTDRDSVKDGAALSETNKCSESYSEGLVADARPGLDAYDDDGPQSSEKSSCNDTLSSTESSKSSAPLPPASDAFTSPAAVFPRWEANLDDDDEWESGHGGFGTGGKVVPANQRHSISSVADAIVAVKAKSKLTPKGEMASQSNQRTLAQAELSRLEETLKKAEENFEEAKTENKPIRVKKYLKEVETLTAQITRARESLEKMGGQTRMKGRYAAEGLDSDAAISSPRTLPTPARARLVGAMKSVRAVTRLTSRRSASTSVKKSSALASADVAKENVFLAVEDATMPVINDDIEQACVAGETTDVRDNLNDESKETSSNKNMKKSRWAGLLGRVKRK